MKSMAEIMATVNAEVAASRFVCAVTGGCLRKVTMVKESIWNATLYRGVSKVARRVGVTQSHLSRVLRGERKAGKELARKLEKLGVKLEGAV